MEEKKQSNELGEILHQWQIPEYEVYERGRTWYIVASLIFASLILYALVTKNFLFALLVFILAVLVFIHHSREPLVLPFIITKKNVIIGNEIFSHESLESFWIVFDPPLSRHIYFQFKSSMRPAISIVFNDEDPEVLRETLGAFIYEDKEKKEEPFSDWLWKALKI